MDSTLDRRMRGAAGAGVDDRLSPPEITSDDEEAPPPPPAKDADRARSRPKKSRAPFEPARMDSPLDRRGVPGVLGRGGSVSVVVVVVDDESEPVNDIDVWRSAVRMMPSSGVGGESRIEASPPPPAADGLSSE
jgi:hypothetical protein